MAPTATERIVNNPGVCGGKPCIAGTRIRVQDIYVWHELRGRSADEIVSEFLQLTMGDVYAALTYYWDHREEIQQQLQDAADFVERMKTKHPSPLAEKLAGKKWLEQSASTWMSTSTLPSRTACDGAGLT